MIWILVVALLNTALLTFSLVLYWVDKRGTEIRRRLGVRS